MGSAMFPPSTSLRFTPLDSGAIAEAATWMAASSPWRDIGLSYGRVLQLMLACRGVGMRGPDASVVAVAFLDTARPESGGISLIAVRPDRRGEGLATHLLATVELDLFRAHDTVTAHAPTGYAPAARFFARNGYRASMELRAFGPEQVDLMLYVKNRPVT
jgi:GNAT superfamily N-acetyltransferase